MGYFIIFRNDAEKYELSAHGSVMRYTRTQNGTKKEYLFDKVDDPEKIEKIEFLSENWKTRRQKEYNYIIKIQCNAQDKLTGYYKVAEKQRYGKLSAGAGNWTYYKRKREQ